MKKLLSEIPQNELIEMMALEAPPNYTGTQLAFEYLRRKKILKKKISCPADILPYIHNYSLRKEEHFLCVVLDGAHQIMKVKLISKGIVNRSLVHPREIYRAAVQLNACAIITAHNHPSGNCTPSFEDKDVVQRLSKAGEVLGIHQLDSIVFAKDNYYSFLEHNEMEAL